MKQKALSSSGHTSRCSAYRRFFGVIVFGIYVGGCSAPAATRVDHAPFLSPAEVRTLAMGVDSVLVDSIFIGGIWSVKISDLTTGRTLFSRNENLNLLPASNAKLYTTAAALDQLGADFRFVTHLEALGDVRNDTLHGDLVIRGSGDPSFSPQFQDGHALRPLEAWADSLQGKGISVITGDVIGDDDLFDDVPLGAGWMWDDEPFEDSAQISALSLNDNCVDVTVRATIPGQPAEVSWKPDSTDYVVMFNRTVTVSEGDETRESYFRERASNRIEVLSEVAIDSEDSECISIENPTRFFAHQLLAVLGRDGIRVLGNPVDIDDVADPGALSGERRIVATYTSPPLSELVAAVNKPSDNLHAELLLRKLGTEFPVADSSLTPGSARMGAEAAARTFAAASVDTSRIRLSDGSGLSRYHLVNTAMTASLLSYMWRHRDQAVRNAFIESLPVGGVDGSLRSRYPDGAARGNVRAKTGTMTSVSSLAGYVRTSSGRPLAFAFMCNNYTSPTSAVRRAQDRIVTRLADLP
ncbi:MAG: D-alanyl-D-alanine carboxypeptidase/D-alanyl-D-alanine-endopeptidase [Rhodothermales bacterium]|nr:D-alanyl-D-alanine carboxypeptidase/D-alanyl-D-alanine-endopeptidase [Rhodothermales bacterium]